MGFGGGTTITYPSNFEILKSTKWKYDKLEKKPTTTYDNIKLLYKVTWQMKCLVLKTYFQNATQIRIAFKLQSLSVSLLNR